MNFECQNNQTTVYWLGQAGYVITSESGKTLCVDPYLSDCCEREFGFKRIIPHLVDPKEFSPDYLFATHAHYDHFDIDAMPDIASNGHTVIYAAADAEDECKKLGIGNVTYIRLHDVVTCGDFTVEAVECDHGELAPLALGLLITVDGKKIYVMGDTAFRRDYLENDKLHGVDLLVAPINGAFGNLDSVQAADAAQILQPKLTIPCHFWNFAEHLGNPAEFMSAMADRKLDYKLVSIGGFICL